MPVFEHLRVLFFFGHVRILGLQVLFVDQVLHRLRVLQPVHIPVVVDGLPAARSLLLVHLDRGHPDFSWLPVRRCCINVRRGVVGWDDLLLHVVQFAFHVHGRLLLLVVAVHSGHGVGELV